MASNALSCPATAPGVPNTPLLGSAILSHPAFYAAFKEDLYSITHGILMSQMGFQKRTLYYAIAAYEASLVDNTDDAKVTCRRDI